MPSASCDAPHCPQLVDEYVQALEDRYEAAHSTPREVLEARLATVRTMLAAVEGAEDRLRSRMAAEATFQDHALLALRTQPSIPPCSHAA